MISCSECREQVACGTRGLVQHMITAHPSSCNRAADVPATCQANRCALCGTSLINAQALRYHLYKHAGLRPYQCSTCSAAFRTPSTLTAHIQVQHLTAAGAGACLSRRHVCQVCGIVASTSGKLKLHQLTHTDEKPFQCAVCAARFRQISNLIVHEFTHTQKSKHKCGRCGRCFATKSKLGTVRYLIFISIR